MSPKVKGWLLISAMVVMLAGGAYVVFKLYQRQKAKRWRAQNQRWEAQGELKLAKELSAEEMAQFLVQENTRLDRYEVLRPIIDELELVAFWKVPGPEEAMERLKASTFFRAGPAADRVIFVAIDPNQQMAGEMRGAVLRSYQLIVRRDALLPQLPVGPEDGQ